MARGAPAGNMEDRNSKAPKRPPRRIRTFLSPVFFKEITQVANQERTYASRTLYLLGLFALLGFVWVLKGSEFSGRNVSTTHAAGFGRSMFLLLIWSEFCVAAIFTPALTANLLTGEKKADTLGLLMITRLSPWNIVQDKGLSRIAFVFHFILVSIPFLFICLMFGGVTTFHIAGSFGCILSMVFLALGAAIFCSTMLSSYFAALLLSYGILLAYLVLVPAVMGIFFFPLFASSGGFNPVAMMILGVNPVLCLVAVLDPSAWGGQQAYTYSWIFSLGICFALYIFAVHMSAKLLPSVEARRMRVPIRRRARRSEIQRQKTWASVVFSPVVKVLKLLERPRRIGWNPVYWREAGLTERPGRMVLIYFAALWGYIFLWFLWWVFCFGDFQVVSDYLGLVFRLSFALVGLFVAIISASTLTAEKEENTLELLLSTRLGAGLVVLGKYLGALRACAIFLVALLVVGLGSALLKDPVSGAVVTKVLIVVPVFMGWVAALGVFLSAVAKNSARAIVSTLLTILLVTTLPVFLYEGVKIVGRSRAGLGIQRAIESYTPGPWVIETFSERTARPGAVSGELDFYSNMLLYILCSVVLLGAAVLTVKWSQGFWLGGLRGLWRSPADWFGRRSTCER
jgi:ABC-type transport system involved in multi-copper enzyme maturation permease subunit